MNLLSKILIGSATALLAVSAQAADVGVSVTIGQPGFYGRIDLGNVNLPQPQVILPQPVLIQPVPVGVVQQPIYLRVPPGHEKNWAKHCRKYNACGQPVYFVRDDWYSNVYVPQYRRDRDDDEDEDGDRNERRGKRKHKRDRDD